jgi:xanthine dehydrogenase accessory factor
VVVRPDTLRDGSPPAGGTQLGGDRLDSAVRADALGLLRQGRTGLLRYGPGGQRLGGQRPGGQRLGGQRLGGHRLGGHRLGDELAVFVASHVPPPRMIVFGAIDFAGALARIGAFLGYRVTVCDARETFATARRFPAADEVVVDQPHRYLASTEVDEATVVCVLTHDPKFDIPLLEVALRRPLAYLGVMGSRRTHADRLARLRARGVADEDLARLRAPIGLDLGGRTPEETAISIAAEIVATRRGGTGAPLRHTSGPLHRDQP